MPFRPPIGRFRTASPYAAPASVWQHRFGRYSKKASRFGELILKLAMHIPAMLVLLHRPEEQRLSLARFLPPLPDVLLLLLVLDKMQFVSTAALALKSRSS